MCKYLSLCLVIILAVSILLMVSPANAQQTPPSANPTLALKAIEVTDRTVKLSWTGSAFTSNSFTSYTLCVFTPSSYDKPLPSWTEIWSTTDRNQTTTIVSNLQPSSRYYFEILDSGNGQIYSSSVLEVHTLPTTSLPTPTVPEFPLILSLIVILVAVSLLLVVGKRKLNFNH
jgi:hypothetical protein